jgi:site-specific recombinase XerD
LLNATDIVSSACSRLQAMTYRTLLLVLYGAGLRISEAIGLTVADIDLAERVLTVRNTKFYKTRLVPIGPQLAATLTTYYVQRSTLLLPKGQDSAFLCSRTGCRLTHPRQRSQVADLSFVACDGGCLATIGGCLATIRRRQGR